ncbi:MAG: DNA-3-methyladenine glycosylase [Ignavibacteria bacterium]|nr:DNA-3-methyladenine glycosylase [Ignavibacteria bacterium]
MIVNFDERLDKDFFQNDTVWVAQNLIGKLLVRKLDGIYVAGMIVEAEAYLAGNDSASHSYVGKTRRNEAMFAEGGSIYVYKIYGIHYCVNIVTEYAGKGCAVLLRSGEPILGFEIFIKNRGVRNIENLLKGPGNFAKAFGFSLGDNFKNLFTEELFVQNYRRVSLSEIGVSGRIGIIKDKDLPLRFYLKGSKFVSARPKD